MIEIRFQGRYGQPVQKLARTVGNYALGKGKNVQVFDAFSAVRPGAPMYSVVRVADEPIRERSANNSKSNVVVVLDNSLFHTVDVTKDLKSGGSVMALNTEQEILGPKTGKNITFVSLNPFFKDKEAVIERNIFAALESQGFL